MEILYEKLFKHYSDSEMPLKKLSYLIYKHTLHWFIGIINIINNDTEMATHFNAYFSSVFTCEDMHGLQVYLLHVDSTSSALLNDSIEITPTVVFNKLMIWLCKIYNKSPRPNSWPIIINKSV